MRCFQTLLKEGPGTPLVFFHGFLGTHLDWLPVCSLLPSCPCIGVDLPGHGNTPFFTPFSFEPPAKRFHLVGYSMGGRIALQYARKHPERIASLLLASTHPGLRSEAEKKERAERDAKWAKLLLGLPIDAFLKRWYDQPLFKNYRPDWSMRSRQNPKELAQALLHYSLSCQNYFNPENAVHITGEEDEKFRALHPGSFIVPRASHAVHLENPGAFAEIVIQNTGVDS